MSYVSYLINVLLIYLLYDYIVKAVLILTVIIVMVKVLSVLSLSTTPNEFSIMEEIPAIDNIELTDDATPSIFINEKNLNFSNVACIENENIFRKAYKIQDMTFIEDYKLYYDGFNSYDKWVEFKLEEIDSEVDLDNNCATDDEELFISYRRVGKGLNGYLINSNVHLTMRQWHTIVNIFDDLLNCVICDAYFEPQSMVEHINTKAHTYQLFLCKPLRRFEFSMTRKIGDKFHCGVCNLVYSVAEEYYHNSNYSHHTNLLAALNRASEFLDDSYDNLNENITKNEFECTKHSNRYYSGDPNNENDDSNVKHKNIDASCDDLGKSDVENDDYSIENSDSYYESDEFNDEHNDNDVASVVLTKYVKNIDSSRENMIGTTSAGTGNVRRSDIIQLTSNCVTTDESPVEQHGLGIKGVKKQFGITKCGYNSNDNMIEKFQNEAYSIDVVNRLNKPESQMKSIVKRKFQRNKDTKAAVITENNINMDENIQIIIKKTHFVIDMFAFNTIVFCGDTKYCFACKLAVSNDRVDSHINNSCHKDNLLTHSFLENYSKHLIRQNNFKYHCSICNVVINHPHLTNHLEWATHQKLSIQCKTKKSLRKSTKVINVATKREDNISNANAPKVKILFHVQIVATPAHVTSVIDKIENIKLEVNDIIFDIDFCNWNGLCIVENGYKCLICGDNFTENIATHCQDRHDDGVLNNIYKKYSPALIRKLNDKYVHCVACNKLLFDDENVISKHITVKKHIKNHSKLINK